MPEKSVHEQMKHRIAQLEAELEKQKQSERHTTQMHYTDFINASGDSVSYWKAPPGLETNLSLDKQIKMLYQSVCIDANKVCWESFGFKSKDRIIGKKYRELIKEKTLDDAFSDFFNNNYQLFDHEFYKKSKDGTIFHGLATWYGVLKNDKLTYLWSVVKDVTKLKEVERALSESEMRHRSILESMDDAVYICSSDFRVEYMNPVMEKRLGHQAIGELCYGAVHGVDKKCSWCVHDQVMKGKRVKNEIKSPYDKKLYMVSHSPIHNRDGSISKLSVYRDISELKKMELTLRQAQKMEALGALSGGIAHDFNNILFPIMGYAEILSDNLDQKDPNRAYVNEVITGAKRAGELVDQILTFSRQAEQSLSAIKPELIIKEVVKLVRSTLPSTIKIEKNIDPYCHMILGDTTQLHQIVMNLITNAYHAMEEFGGVLTVKLQNVEDTSNINDVSDIIQGPSVLLTISDTGIGMDEAVKDRIFNPYFTTKGIEKGTGLGLSVVHRIVASFNGFIQVESNPGKGSIFKIYFPAILQEEPFEPDVMEKDFNGGKERILIVDDEPQILKLETELLERLGYEVRAEKSSLKALELITQNPGMVDLVITDMTMPDITGDLLAEKMMEVRPNLPIIICTGFSEKMDKAKAEELGIREVLYKPVAKSDLAGAIRNVLDKLR